MNNLLTVTYPASHPLTFTYDALNRLSTMADTNGTTTFTYTPASQLASETGPWASDTVTYTYANQLRSELDLQQPNASDSLQTYDYDATRRLTSVASPAGSFTYTYDTGRNGYATASQLPVNLSLPNGAFIGDTYDSNGRMLTTVLYNSGSGVLDYTGYTNNAGNQRISQVRGNTDANWVAYTYDAIGQVLTDTASESGGAARLNEQLKYGYDPAGNLLGRTNNFLMQSFYVNSLNELTNNASSGTLTVVGTTTSPPPATTNVTVNSTTASVYGDSTFAAPGFPLTTTTFTATAKDTNGRVSINTVSVNLSTDVNFQYDGNGNLTNDGFRSFSYDDENELSQVWVASQWLSQFTYDGKMRRRIRREYAWQGSAWVETNEVHYIYDGNRVVQERDINNLPLATYIRGNDLSGSLEGAGGIGGLLARSDLTTAQPAFYYSDGNGNVRTLINSQQAIVAKYIYDAFGNTLSKAGSLADANLYRFSSKEAHINSGLAYYLYRYYDPNLQRWPNRDPLGEPGFEMLQKQKPVTFRTASVLTLGGSLNPYEFVQNQPTLAYDAFGLAPATGPNSEACKQALANAALALAIARQTPTQENIENAREAVADAAAACKPPPTPPEFCPVWPGTGGNPLHLPPSFWPTVGIGIGIGATCILCPECCVVIIPAL